MIGSGVMGKAARGQRLVMAQVADERVFLDELELFLGGGMLQQALEFVRRQTPCVAANCWASGRPEVLLAPFRLHTVPSHQDDCIGFRFVLEI